MTSWNNRFWFSYVYRECMFRATVGRGELDGMVVQWVHYIALPPSLVAYLRYAYTSIRYSNHQNPVIHITFLSG